MRVASGWRRGVVPICRVLVCTDSLFSVGAIRRWHTQRRAWRYADEDQESVSVDWGAWPGLSAAAARFVVAGAQRTPFLCCQDGDDEEDDDDDDDFDGALNTRLGENMSGTAVPGRVLAAPRGIQQPPLPTSQSDVILNFGIIDILQEYNLSKQVEHTWKVCLSGLQCQLIAQPDVDSSCCVHPTDRDSAPRKHQLGQPH